MLEALWEKTRMRRARLLGPCSSGLFVHIKQIHVPKTKRGRQTRQRWAQSYPSQSTRSSICWAFEASGATFYPEFCLRASTSQFVFAKYHSFIDRFWQCRPRSNRRDPQPPQPILAKLVDPTLLCELQILEHPHPPLVVVGEQLFLIINPEHCLSF